MHPVTKTGPLAAVREWRRAQKRRPDYSDGSKWLRLWLVLSGLSPVLILLAIRGTPLMPPTQFYLLCGVLFLAANLVLVRIGLIAFLPNPPKWLGYQDRDVIVGTAVDRRQDVISYLFAMLLPFYTIDLTSEREVYASIAAFLLVAMLFWGLNLHYLNLWIVLRGYRCFQVTSQDDGTVRSNMPDFMVVTRSPTLRSGRRLRARGISNSVLIFSEFD